LIEVSKEELSQAKAAQAKITGGGKPTTVEAAALRKAELAVKERAAWEIYASVPSAHYQEMSERSARSLKTQGKRFGIPVGGAAVSLIDVVKWIHDYFDGREAADDGRPGPEWFSQAECSRFLNVTTTQFARKYRGMVRDDNRKRTGRVVWIHGRSLVDAIVRESSAVAPDMDGDPLLSGATSPALERYREERAKMARLQRLEKEEALVPRDELRNVFATMTSVIRRAGEKLQKQFGVKARKILDKAIDKALERAREMAEEDSDVIDD
jgi:hypothetical protein